MLTGRCIRISASPGDIDTYPEMNNGRFWTVMDFGRYDRAFRSGLMRMAHRNGWFFVAAGGSIRYRRRTDGCFLTAHGLKGPS